MKHMVYFGAEWCGPCKALKRETIDPLIEEGYDIKFVSLTEHPEESIKYKIVKVPTAIVYNSDDSVYNVYSGNLPTMDDLRDTLRS